MNSEQATKLLAELVAIPSMNPMGRRREGPEFSEQALAEFLMTLFKRNGIDAERYDASPGRPNVMAYIDAGRPETLMLEAHMDTVHVDNMTVKPFDPVVRDGRMYGRGSCDTKGSIASFCSSVFPLLKSVKKLKFNILFLFVSDEEYRFTGASAAVARGLKASFGIAGEPTSLAIVRAHKGVTRWKMRTKGLSAHAAYPERGRNAIYAMAPLVESLAAYASELSAMKPHPLLGAPSLNVGVIEGGQAVNMVPDECWIEVDRRSLPGENTEGIMAPIRAVARALENVEIEPPHLSVSGMEIPADSAIVRLLSDAVKRFRGNVQIESAQYATDAGVFVSAGIPTAVFGPGDIAQAHTDSEFIELQQLDAAVQILRNVIAV